MNWEKEKKKNLQIQKTHAKTRIQFIICNNDVDDGADDDDDDDDGYSCCCRHQASSLVAAAAFGISWRTMVAAVDVGGGIGAAPICRCQLSRWACTREAVNSIDGWLGYGVAEF